LKFEEGSLGMHEEIVCKTEEDMVKLGNRFGELAKPGMIISLRGSLGAGKTVFARGVARSLGIEEAIVSPTFTLVQEYDGRLPMYHMDLYRITSSEDFEMIGGEDMLYSDGVCLIEWSEIINEMLPKDTVFINITVNPDQSRTVTIDSKEDK
jgi:tRNA threonylcarbamoyladenosine biosynthesis protein TsaE